MADKTVPSMGSTSVTSETHKVLIKHWRITIKKSPIILVSILYMLAGCNISSDSPFIGKWAEKDSSSYIGLTLYRTNDALFNGETCVWKKIDKYTALVTCNKLGFEFKIDKNNPSWATGFLGNRYHRIE